LHLGWNKIRDEGVQFISNALQNNTVEFNLYLSMTNEFHSSIFCSVDIGTIIPSR